MSWPLALLNIDHHQQGKEAVVYVRRHLFQFLGGSFVWSLSSSRYGIKWPCWILKTIVIKNQENMSKESCPSSADTECVIEATMHRGGAPSPVLRASFKVCVLTDRDSYERALQWSKNNARGKRVQEGTGAGCTSTHTWEPLLCHLD